MNRLSDTHNDTLYGMQLYTSHVRGGGGGLNNGIEWEKQKLLYYFLFGRKKLVLKFGRFRTWFQ